MARRRSYDEWLAGLDGFVSGRPLELRVYGTVHGARGAYPLVRLTTRSAGVGQPTLLVTAGFHGDETAGPMLLTGALPLLLALLADGDDVALDIFPCVNPTGFELGTRYNARGERPNNELLRYELPDGTGAGELPSPRAPFRRWAPCAPAAEETRALLAALEASPPHDAAIDLHQDPSARGPGTYCYHLGPREPLEVAQETAARIVPVLRDADVWAGRTDAQGFIEAHDGSVTDYTYRRGARHAVCVETTTDTPLQHSLQVYELWMSTMIALAAGRRRERRLLETLANPFTRGPC